MANKLFMILLGCKPKGRHTEQHDIFFTIGKSIKDIIPHIESFWKDGGTIHIDAWREVTEVDGNAILKGAFTINRLDFEVGDSSFILSDNVYISIEVKAVKK
jgi:hypothetical protein